VDPAAFGLKIGLFRDQTSVLLAFQDTWASDPANFLKTAQLVYNSGAITTALAAENPVKCTMEMEITPLTGGAFKIQSPVLLKPGLITPASATVALPEVVATQAFVKQTCMPRDGTDPLNPCREFYALSVSGFPIRITWDDDGHVIGQRY